MKSVRCPVCQLNLEGDFELTEEVKCPSCLATFVPARILEQRKSSPSPMVRSVSCPYCDTLLEGDFSPGEMLRCPACGGEFSPPERSILQKAPKSSSEMHFIIGGEQQSFNTASRPKPSLELAPRQPLPTGARVSIVFLVLVVLLSFLPTIRRAVSAGTIVSVGFFFGALLESWVHVLCMPFIALGAAIGLGLRKRLGRNLVNSIGSIICVFLFMALIASCAPRPSARNFDQDERNLESAFIAALLFCWLLAIIAVNDKETRRFFMSAKGHS